VFFFLVISSPALFSLSFSPHGTLFLLFLLANPNFAQLFYGLTAYTLAVILTSS